MNNLIINVSLENPSTGYACLHRGNKKVTLFLGAIAELFPYLGSEFLPFQNLEEIIEEIVIHELIHKFTGVIEDKIIDSWHRLLCNLYPKYHCTCPINCFWRDSYDK